MQSTSSLVISPFVICDQTQSTFTTSTYRTPARLDMAPRLDFELLLSVAEHVKESVDLLRGSDPSVTKAIKLEKLALLSLMKACKVSAPLSVLLLVTDQ